MLKEFHTTCQTCRQHPSFNSCKVHQEGEGGKKIDTYCELAFTHLPSEILIKILPIGI